MKAKLADLERSDVTEKMPQPKEHKKIDLKTSGISSTLDLRGKTAEDAYIEIDRYFDSAIMSGLNEVTVLHGKGKEGSGGKASPSRRDPQKLRGKAPAYSRQKAVRNR